MKRKENCPVCGRLMNLKARNVSVPKTKDRKTYKYVKYTFSCKGQAYPYPHTNMTWVKK